MNPQERDNRGDHRDERNRADQREEKNREEQRKEKADKPSRLGKEAKIGVTVILLLLGAFAAVVAVKMTKGDTDEKQLAVAEHDGERHKSLATKDDPLFSGMSEKSFGHHPTMVPPAKASSGSLPGSVDSNLDKWKMPSERNEAKRVQSRYAAPMAPPSLPPSFATDPPKPARGSRYDLAADNSLPGLEPEKPGRFGRKPTDLPPPPPLPEVKKRPVHADSVAAVTTREGFERGESSGFADADSGSRAGHHEKSRYEPSAALMAPEPPRERPSRDDGGRSYGGSSRSQYDDDIARASAPPPYESEKSRRYDPPSYGDRALRHDGKYEVQPGDSYWTISEKVYGTKGYFRALAEQNRGKFGDVDRLTPGDVILAPPVAQLEKAYPELCPKPGRHEMQESRAMAVSTRESYRGGRSYTVSEGDTLFNIARYELGKAARWVEIYDLNREVLGKDFNYLTPGMKLVLPDNDKGEVLTRKSGDLYR
jgi:nucleoid-associated protein YgaU